MSDQKPFLSVVKKLVDKMLGKPNSKLEQTNQDNITEANENHERNSTQRTPLWKKILPL